MSGKDSPVDSSPLDDSDVDRTYNVMSEDHKLKRARDIPTSQEEAALQACSQDLLKRKGKSTNTDEPEPGCSHYPTEQPEHLDVGSAGKEYSKQNYHTGK